MPSVRIREGEPFEKAFRRFTKSCEKAGLMSEIKKHQHFEKPSAKRKRKINTARRKQRRMLMLEGQ
ncbi:30S ribosomal protein S21 [bacterium]|nr:30S ribosomal protein S21 [bacterium]